MSSETSHCQQSPDGLHHWKFGKCSHCQKPEGKILHGVTMATCDAEASCPKGGKCSFKFAKCRKCGRAEGVLSSARQISQRQSRERSCSRGSEREHPRSSEELSVFNQIHDEHSELKCCQQSPDGVHHWKFGKCSYCQKPEGKHVPSAQQAVVHRDAHEMQDHAARVKMECPTCGYKCFPQWLNDEAHCLKCDGVLKRRPSCHEKSASRGSSPQPRRLSGEVCKPSPRSVIEPDSNYCQQSPDDVHHWKFGKCSYCQMPEGKMLHGGGATLDPRGHASCEKGGKCMFKFAKCTKCGRNENEIFDDCSSVAQDMTSSGRRVESSHGECAKDGDTGCESVPVGGGLKAVRKLQRAHSNSQSDDEQSTSAGSDDEEPMIKVPSNSSDSCSELRETFQSFCGSSSDMDGKSFSKLCKDCALLDKSFSAADVDIVFAKAVKGRRRVSWSNFEDLLRLVAERKGVPNKEILELVSHSQGPVLQGTHAESVRFHDDKSTYTGTHVNGGPESVPVGVGTAGNHFCKRN